jgi:hypothetical protein
MRRAVQKKKKTSVLSKLRLFFCWGPSWPNLKNISKQRHVTIIEWNKSRIYSHQFQKDEIGHENSKSQETLFLQTVIFIFIFLL